MARQSMSDKKVKRLAVETGLDLVAVLVRGGTNHRKDLYVKGGGIVHLYRGGRMETSNSLTHSLG